MLSYGSRTAKGAPFYTPVTILSLKLGNFRPCLYSVHLWGTINAPGIGFEFGVVLSQLDGVESGPPTVVVYYASACLGVRVS